jgi:hypothetical protein
MEFTYDDFRRIKVQDQVVGKGLGNDKAWVNHYHRCISAQGGAPLSSEGDESSVCESKA